MRHDYECVNSDSFKSKQRLGKGELITAIALLVLVITLSGFYYGRLF